MRYGIIAEGHSDISVIKSIVKALIGIDGSEIVCIRPEEQYDECDLSEMSFSNWGLVLASCADEQLLKTFFDELEDDALLIVQIDTAERGEVGYDISTPVRSGSMDWKQYATDIRKKTKKKISELIPDVYREKVAYAIAIEETDAWLIPLFDRSSDETAQYFSPKEKLQKLIGKLSKKERQRYVNTQKKSVNYIQVSGLLRKELSSCRKHCISLDMFCDEFVNRHSY